MNDIEIKKTICPNCNCNGPFEVITLTWTNRYIEGSGTNDNDDYTEHLKLHNLVVQCSNCDEYVWVVSHEELQSTMNYIKDNIPLPRCSTLNSSS